MKARLKKHAPRAFERLTEEVFTALDQQTVVVASLHGMCVWTGVRILTEVVGKHFASAVQPPCPRQQMGI